MNVVIARATCAACGLELDANARLRHAAANGHGEVPVCSALCQRRVERRGVRPGWTR